MNTIIIENLDDDLKSAIKIQAAYERKTIRQFIIDILKNHEDIQKIIKEIKSK
jgi:plasmid stability protein